MQNAIRAAMLLICFGAPCLADAPQSSIRPALRPTVAQSEMTLSTQAAAIVASKPDVIVLRPRARPVTEASVLPALTESPQSAAAEPKIADVAVSSVLSSVPRPEPRPALAIAKAQPVEKVETVAAIRILPGKNAVFGKKGSVCGVPGIKGEKLAPITSRVKGCGVDEPVRITSVDGVRLSTPATLNCDTALALNDWVKTGLKPAFGRKDVVELTVAASYACRPRNNVKGAPISEHGRGKAIDISAIILSNGKSVSVLDDWRDSAGKPMKAAYRAACGVFGTTIGPDGDRYHRNHMHFDTARQRGGAYCR
jgi:hypothetical protein